jgi:hypothetical protein
VVAREGLGRGRGKQERGRDGLNNDAHVIPLSPNRHGQGCHAS